VRGLGVRKIFGLVNQNDPAGHWCPFRMTTPRRVRALRARAIPATASASGAAAIPMIVS